MKSNVRRARVVIRLVEPLCKVSVRCFFDRMGSPEDPIKYSFSVELDGFPGSHFVAASGPEFFKEVEASLRTASAGFLEHAESMAACAAVLEDLMGAPAFRAAWDIGFDETARKREKVQC